MYEVMCVLELNLCGKIANVRVFIRQVVNTRVFLMNVVNVKIFSVNARGILVKF